VKQYEIEIILCRHWASYLNTPIFIVDPQGNLAYYNEPAEKILGRRFAETGEMPMEEWSSVFKITDENHNPLKPEEIPLSIALRECRPIHMGLWLAGLDDVRRRIQTTCFPLIGQADRFLGAVALFWEVDDK
jgi:PAS domain-containing protein